jgi:hypothetical protein
MYRFPRLISVASSMIALTFLSVQSIAEEIDDEIIRLRKELSRQQIECQRVRSDIEKEKKDFKAYTADTEQRVKRTMAEIDSLKLDIARASRKSDSLEAQIESFHLTQQQIDKLQSGTRQGLINACVEIERVVKNFPPLTAVPLTASVSLLKSDLNQKTIDNIEGANRLYTILSQVEEASGSIQVSQENSPTADIRGSVYRVRLGSFFEAVVDEKGEKAALFKGYDSHGEPKWQLTDAQVASAIRTAAVVRDGKALPTFVKLPLGGDSDSKGESR